MGGSKKSARPPILLLSLLVLSAFLLSPSARPVRANSVVATVSIWAPQSVAFDPDNGCIYVGDGSSYTVSVISGSTNKVIATVPLAHGITDLFGIAYDSANGDIYVTSGDGMVYVISGSTNEVIANVSLGGNPIGVAFDSTNGNIYVADSGVVVMNGANSVVARISIPGLGPVDSWGIAFDSANGDLYMSDSGSNITEVISGSTNAVISSVTSGGPGRGVAFDPVNGYVYVASAIAEPNDTGYVSIIDGATNTPVGHVTAGYDLEGVAVDPVKGNVYVVDGEENLFAISGSTGKVMGSVPIGDSALAFDPSNGDIYVADTVFHTVSVVSPASITTVASSSSSTSSSSTTTASVSSGGGIPEFPYQLAAVSLFTVLVVASYLVVRDRRSVG